MQCTYNGLRLNESRRNNIILNDFRMYNHNNNKSYLFCREKLSKRIKQNFKLRISDPAITIKAFQPKIHEDNDYNIIIHKDYNL